MNEFNLIRSLYTESKNVDQLTEEFDRGPQFIRKQADYLMRVGAITKRTINRRTYYKLTSKYQRRIGWIKMHRYGSSEPHLVSMPEFLQAYDPYKDTQFTKAAKNLYRTMMQLLLAGAEHQNTKETISNDTDAYNKQIKRQKMKVRQAKIELAESIQILEKNLKIMRSLLAEDEFWNIESLSNHMAAFVDNDGSIVPPMTTITQLMEHPLAHLITQE